MGYKLVNSEWRSSKLTFVNKICFYYIQSWIKKPQNVFWKTEYISKKTMPKFENFLTLRNFDIDKRSKSSGYGKLDKLWYLLNLKDLIKWESYFRINRK